MRLQDPRHPLVVGDARMPVATRRQGTVGAGVLGTEVEGDDLLVAGKLARLDDGCETALHLAQRRLAEHGTDGEEEPSVRIVRSHHLRKIYVRYFVRRSGITVREVVRAEV